MGEDRNRHSEAGKGDKDGLGHKVGKGVQARRETMKTETKAGMGQTIPEKVRREVEGKGGKG